jgi:hypothetical protein
MYFIMAIIKDIEKLCTPALIFFVLSVLGIVVSLFSMRFLVDPVLILVKIAYVAFWTYLLSVLCKHGHRELSWVLLFLPFITVAAVVIIATVVSGLTTMGHEVIHHGRGQAAQKPQDQRQNSM